ncbi:hypothetical protein H2200_012834 [Cladophialophora chaetospira]|uniref:Peroxin 11C n=1 Tax=Cladophialophora chaetospira TaxID=386627 RepID=A0AA38WWX1_9EURO|nr:hypothetical protein H2200_012834 [Cladophialophora chaetospira]
MSSSEAAHPDPSVVPQDPSEAKGEVAPVKPGQYPALNKVPSEVKSTLSKADDTIIRISKLIKTTAGLGAALSTLNYSIYLAAYLHANAPTRAAIVAYVSRLIGRTPQKAPAGVLAPTLPTSFSDSRWSTHLGNPYSTALDGTYTIIHMAKDVALQECAGYIGFQSLENFYTLAGKGIVPVSILEKRGGVAKWVAWSCRAWTVGVASDFLRLWREAEINKEKRSSLSTKEREEFDRKWWNEFMVAAYWMPVAIHYSLFPTGIPGMNTGLVGFFGLMAGLNNFRNQWAATA